LRTYRDRLDVGSRKLELDAVFFTGDLTFSGQVEQYKLATKMLDEVLDACGLATQRDKVFIVPGNHDVDRGAITSGIKSYFKDLLDPREKTDENDE